MIGWLSGALVLGVASALIGALYLTLAAVTIWEMVAKRARGKSHFGLAFAAIMVTCGGHHLSHGLHIAALHHQQSPLAVLFGIVLGIIPALVFLWLRVEAMTGRRGERFISGTPAPVVVLPMAVSLGTGAAFAVAITDWSVRPDFVLARFLSNVVLGAIYVAIGWLYGRTQVRRRMTLGGWSLSGLAVAVVFPTCAVMHFNHALTNGGGHATTAITMLAVPASLYFLWAVSKLYIDALMDWNRQPVVGRATKPRRGAPWDESFR